MTSPISDNPVNKSKVERHGLFLWAVGGVVLLLVQAIFRLGQITVEGLFGSQMESWQYYLCGAWVITNCYLEGYRGFQKKFVPRVLARAHHLTTTPSATFPLLAPLFSMAYFKATRKARYAAWGVTTLVILAITIVRQVPQPWRGIIDAGVVAGLLWGTSVLIWGAILRTGGQVPLGDPELG